MLMPMASSDDSRLETLRFPIGRFRPAPPYSPADVAAHVESLTRAPERLRAAVRGLSPAQLDTPYRAGGWTVRQVVHHLPDSHLNSYTRFRLALTEDEPTIRPYLEARWAELSDARSGPIELSLDLFAAVHARLVALLRTLRPEQWQRRFYHPEAGMHFRLDTALAMYAWHGAHHTAHVTALREREGWVG
jgi:uncharacterized damage-inducible protein DinB